ncbi:hypothetical protein CBS101457_004408 [Exobasidium rhododendri]|nr:hypothetical protein CBS101457_004408 [Exobasidium rhododendri]
MPASRKSTPRRGRSSSVVSNVSATSAKQESVSTPRRGKAASAAAKEESTPATPTSAKSSIARPPLPTEINPVLPSTNVPVKLQVIRRDGKNIIIGRVKLPTVGGTDHAFLLKRFDTNAIAASSMFRLAFPFADGDAENGEMAYLESKFDAEAANGGMRKVLKRSRGKGARKTQDVDTGEEELPEGSTGVKLQGTWIPCADAPEIAKEYGLLRFAQPLIDAQASQTQTGQLILTPSKLDKNSTPSSQSSKKESGKKSGSLADEASEPSPTITRIRTTKRVKGDGSEDVLVEKSEITLEPASKLTAEQIEAQIKESQSFAKGIQSSANSTPSSSSSSKKRRAVNQTPTADVDVLADEDYEGSNAVVRSLRKGGRAVRRRPIISTAGALSAIGAGTLAWISGGSLDVATHLVQQNLDVATHLVQQNLDVAAHLLQQGVANVGSWFF